MDLPDLKRKQKLLFDESTPAATLVDLGRRMVEAGWLSDAIDCFERARNTDGLEGLRRRSVEEGDWFLLRRCLKALKAEAAPDEWQTLAERAETLGKLQFAREAYRLSGDRKALDRIDAQLAPPPAQAAELAEPTPAEEGESEA